MSTATVILKSTPKTEQWRVEISSKLTPHPLYWTKAKTKTKAQDCVLMILSLFISGIPGAILQIVLQSLYLRLHYYVHPFASAGETEESHWSPNDVFYARLSLVNILILVLGMCCSAVPIGGKDPLGVCIVIVLGTTLAYIILLTIMGYMNKVANKLDVLVSEGERENASEGMNSFEKLVWGAKAKLLKQWRQVEAKLPAWLVQHSRSPQVAPADRYKQPGQVAMDTGTLNINTKEEAGKETQEKDAAEKTRK